MTRFISMFLVALLAASPSAGAFCAVSVLTTEVVTKDAKVPAGGGLLVVTVPDRSHNSKYGPHPMDPRWRFRAGGKLHVPDSELLAPGLAIYRLPKGITSGELVDGKTVLGKLTVTTQAVPLLPAPKIKKLDQTTSFERKGSSTRMIAELAADPPAGAIALVVADAKVARSYGSPSPGHRHVVVYDHSPCGEDPAGTVASGNGEQLRLYWLDQAGRASPSTTVKLTAVFEGGIGGL